MNKILMFPVDYFQGVKFLENVKNFLNPKEKVDVLLLKKQIMLYDYLSTNDTINKIITLDEPLYHIASENSLKVIERLSGYDCCYFPNTVFNGNLSVMALCIAKEITIINAWHNNLTTINRSELIQLTHSGPPPLDPKIMDLVNKSKEKVIRNKKMYSKINSNQRSDFGFITDFPSQTERMFSYINLIKEFGEKPCRVLEIGSGTGHYAYILSHFVDEYIAFDIDKPTIDNCNSIFKNPGLKYVDSKESIEGQFDIIICYEVIEHVEKPLDFMRSFINYFHENTSFVVSTPNYNNFPWRCYTKELKNKSIYPELNHDELLKEGILSVHVVELDETWLINKIEKTNDLKISRICYTTFDSGIRLLQKLCKSDESIDFNYDIFKDHSDISIHDFSVTPNYIPGFSSYSFYAYLEKRRLNNEIKR